jgi:hypothetical protein
MVCTACGKPINEGDAFCSKCGAKQTPPAPSTNPLVLKKLPMAQMYQAYLRAEGYLLENEPSGDVRFKFEGGNYWINIDPEDKDYFRILYPSFWPIKGEPERAKVDVAALHATARTKVAKILPSRDNVSAAVEILCSPPENFKFVFKRLLGVLQFAVKTFVEKMREAPPPALPPNQPAVTAPTVTSSAVESFSIAHDHGAAACYGQLTIDDGVIRYRCSDKDGHSFDFPLSSITSAEEKQGVTPIEFHFNIRLRDGNMYNFFSVDGSNLVLKAIQRALTKQ